MAGCAHIFPFFIFFFFKIDSFQWTLHCNKRHKWLSKNDNVRRRKQRTNERKKNNSSSSEIRTAKKRIKSAQHLHKTTKASWQKEWKLYLRHNASISLLHTHRMPLCRSFYSSIEWFRLCVYFIGLTSFLFLLKYCIWIVVASFFVRCLERASACTLLKQAKIWMQNASA